MQLRAVVVWRPDRVPDLLGVGQRPQRHHVQAISHHTVAWAVSDVVQELGTTKIAEPIGPRDAYHALGSRPISLLRPVGCVYVCMRTPAVSWLRVRRGWLGTIIEPLIWRLLH